MKKKSKYVIEFNIDDNIYYYNLITGNFNIKKNVKEDDQNYYSEENTNEFENLINYNNSLRKNCDFLCITLVLTKACNFVCPYCFEDKNNNTEFSKEAIPFLLKYIQEYYFRHPQLKHLVIFWFGGEPTLKIDLMLEISRKLLYLCESLDINYTSRIITNGYLIDRLEPFIKELHLTDIQITIDGLGNFHDSRRKLKSGKGTFDVIIKNICQLKEKLNLIIRVNVDKENIDNLIQIYKYIINLNLYRDIDLYFQPMMVDDYGGSSECYCYKGIYDENFIRKFNNLKLEMNTIEEIKFIKSFCNIDFPGTIVIDNRGLIFRCWAAIENKNLAIGNISNKVEDILLKTEYSPFILKNEKCSDCTYFPICMGGCKYQHFSDTLCKFKIYNIEQKIFLNVAQKVE